MSVNCALRTICKYYKGPACCGYVLMYIVSMLNVVIIAGTLVHKLKLGCLMTGTWLKRLSCTLHNNGPINELCMNFWRCLSR